MEGEICDFLMSDACHPLKVQTAAMEGGDALRAYAQGKLGGFFSRVETEEEATRLMATWIVARALDGLDFAAIAEEIAGEGG